MTLIDFIIALFGAFFGVFFGAVMLNGPKKLLLPASLIGAVCWGVYLLVLPHTGAVVATFISSVVVAWVSHLSARKFKAPVTMFFIPAFLPLVPGITLYRAVFYMLNNDNDSSMAYLILTVQIAMAIALAIFTVDSLFSLYSRIKKSCKF